MASGSLSFPFEKLRGRENFDNWRRNAKSYLVLKSCWKITQNGLSEGSSEKDHDSNERALAEITLMVEPCNFSHIASAVTAKDAWDSLMAAYEDSGLTRKVELLKKLVQLKLEQFQSVQDYVNDMVMTAIKLRNAGLDVGDELVASLLLAGLPNEYQSLVMAVENSRAKLTVDSVKSLLLQDVKFDCNKESTDNALYSKNFQQKRNVKNSNRKRFRCYNCGQEGHVRKECRKSTQTMKVNENEGKNKTAMFSNSLLANSCLHSQSGESVWYIDSGATSHMTNDQKLLSKLRTAEHNEVILANRERVPVNSVGEVNLVLKVNRQKIETNIRNVEYVPSLCANLLSVRQITKQNKKVVFEGNVCKVYDVKNRLIAKAYAENGLYKLDCAKIPVGRAMTTIDSFELWHRRLAHICKNSMNQVQNSTLGVNYSDVSENGCIVCCKGKQTRIITKSAGTRAENLLDIIHSDVLGPISTKSFSGARFLLVFVDDFSRKVFAIPIVHKSDVFEKFKQFKNEVETQCGRKIKVLRTDNGTEYCNSQFIKFIRESGIVHQKTAPYTPEQNGVAERMNRTLIERVRCMLLDSGLENIFWAEAANTAAYLVNRIPCRGKSQSPEEIWSGVRPNLKHLRIFGCTAMVYIPKQKRLKLDAKSDECVFVGYCVASKAYRLYRKSDNKFIVSRDVKFLEDSYNKSKRAEPNLIVDIINEKESNDINNSGEVIESELSDVSNSSDNEYDENEAADQHNNKCVVRRSERIANKSKGSLLLSMMSDGDDPVSLEAALNSPEAGDWKRAMKEEIDSHKSNKTWVLTKLPKGKRAINSKWVFKTKRNAEGAFVRYKARLVVKGCSQKQGIDYSETFSPVVRYNSLRFLFAMAAKHDLSVHQLDAVTAFLNGELQEEVFMKQPEGYDDNSGRVCRLLKSLYGLKQASKVWNDKLNEALISLGLNRSEVDQCIYYCVSKHSMVYVAIYVDDVLVFSNDKEATQRIKNVLSSKFKMKDMGSVSSVLGMRVQRDEVKKLIKLDQSEYISSVLKRFGMNDCNAVATPLDLSQKLTLEICPQTEEAKKEMEKIPYMEAIGSLLYAAQNTRPDISFAVNLLSRFSQNPGKAHWLAVKRVMRYLKGTVNKGIVFQKSAQSLVGYCDADWAGDLDQRRSTSGYVFVMQGGAISWSSHRQRTVALSSTEAELTSVVSAMQEAIWLHRLESELIHGGTKGIKMYCDNKSAIHIVRNNNFSPRTKHVDIKAKFIREKLQDKPLQLEYISTNEMLADGLTKAIPTVKNEFINIKLGLQ